MKKLLTLFLLGSLAAQAETIIAPVIVNSLTIGGTAATPTGTNTAAIATVGYVQSFAASGVAGVATFNGRAGAVTQTSADVTNALGYTPAQSGVVAIGSGGTGATTAATARTNLGLGTAATQASTAFDPAGAAAAITTITGNAGTATALAVNPVDCTAGQFANAIAANGDLTCATPAGGGGSSGVSTFNTRTGDVTLTSGDVSAVLATVPINKGGTNTTSFNAPVLSVNPLIYYDGTSLVSDAIPSHLGYNAATDTLHSGAVDISNATTQTAKFTNTGASGASSGAGMQGYSDDGAPLAAGDRLGFYLLGGATDNAHTTSNAAGLASYATEAWTGAATGANLTLSTTPNGSTTRTDAVTIGQDQSVTLNALSASSEIVKLNSGKLVSATAGADYVLPSGTVAAVGGVTITGTPTAGQVPTATSGTAATWQTVAGGSSTPKLGNLLVNSGAMVKQRVVPPTITTAYLIGKVANMAAKVEAGFPTTGVITQATTSLAGSTGYAMRVTNLSVPSASTIVGAMRMESLDAVQYKNKTVSISASVAQDTGVSASCNIVLNKAGVADNWAGKTLIAAGLATTVPTSIGTLVKLENVAIGDATLGIEIEVKCTNTAGIVARNFDFTEFQIVEATTAPTYVAKNFAEEDERARRYAEVWVATNTVTGLGFGNAYSATHTYHTIPFKTEKRVVITGVLTSGAGHFRVATGAGIPVVVIALGFSGYSTSSVLFLDCTVAGSVIIGQGSFASIAAVGGWLLVTGAELF